MSLSYKASRGCEDLAVYLDPRSYMTKLYLESSEGFTDLEIKRALSRKAFLVSRAGVCMLRSQINKGVNCVVNINGEKREGSAVWRWRGNDEE